MARAGFFDDNRNRAYPFIVGTVARPVVGSATLLNLPNSVIVDCGFTFGPSVYFDPTIHAVYLSKLRRAGTIFYFEFASTCPDLADVTLTFSRNVTDAEYLTEFNDSGTVGISLSYSGSGNLANDCGQPLWTGFLVTGPLDDANQFLSGTGIITGTTSTCTVEPALLLTLYKSSVTSINLANDDRTRYENPEDCDPVAWPYPVALTFVNARCIQGDVLFQPGYNADVRQNYYDNAITIAANVGSGEGQPCAEISLFSTEEPPAGSGLLSGGSACGETIQTINGVNNSNFIVQAGNGVQIEAIPEENKIIVDINLAGAAVIIPESLMPA